MEHARAWFDARWPRLEVYGLRAAGAWMIFLGTITILGSVESSPTAKLLAYPSGSALILGGLLAVDRSREDLVTWTIAGIAAIVFTLSLAASAAPDPEAMHASAYPPLLIWIGAALFGVRAFRGAFRRRRQPHGVEGWG